MDIGKTPVSISSYYDGMTQAALASIQLALSILSIEHSRSAGYVQLTTSAAVTVGAAININNGLVRLADAATAIAAQGICVKSAGIGQKAGIMLLSGYANGFTGLTPNSAIYTGNAGALVYAIPGAGMKQAIGWALSATEMLVNIGQPF
jgi:hypothetical protein